MRSNNFVHKNISYKKYCNVLLYFCLRTFKLQYNCYISNKIEHCYYLNIDYKFLLSLSNKMFRTIYNIKECFPTNCVSIPHACLQNSLKLQDV